MGKQLDSLTPELTKFIHRQPVFFVATAPGDGRVNVSPKGMDSLRVLDGNRIIWLNVTGSGNETAAHILQNGRMTLMWCAFHGAPMILRTFGTARTIQPRDAEWSALAEKLPDIPGARQIFDLTVEMVQTSCGMAVPLMDFQGDRELLRNWADRQEPEELDRYRRNKNTVSIDGLPTGL